MRQTALLVLLIISSPARAQEFVDQVPLPEIDTLVTALSLEDARVTLTPDQYAAVARVSRLFDRERYGKGLAVWRDFVKHTYTGRSGLDYDAIALALTKERLLKLEGIDELADRYEFYRNLRLQILAAESLVSDYAKNAAAGDEFAVAELQSRLTGLLQLMEQLGQDSELMQLSLRNALEQRQQSVQLVSNILKALDATTDAVINNLK